MSLVTLATSLATKISETTISDILGAFRLQFVGRNSSGAPESGQDLGTITYPWGVGHFNSVRIAGEAIDVSNIVSPANRVISGAVRTNSEQPQFISIPAASNTVTVLGTTTNLELSINATAVSVESDIVFSSLTVAPAANNTCLVNDATLTDQLSSKYTGEDNTILTIGTVGSEITDRIGELVALRKNPSGEIMLAYVKSATELTNIYRGFFYDDGDDPIVRETLADGDQLDLKSLGWIFIEDTGTSGEIIYTNPVYSYTEPAAPTAAVYWFDMATNIWKRGNGTAFVQINRKLVGLVVIGLSNTIGYRCVDFFHDYRDANTIDLEVFSDEVISSKDKTNNVYVYSRTLRINPTKLTWDNTADMETGSVAASTTYYLYLASTGERIISLEKYYTRNDLLGKYHPYEAWRFIGEGTTDGTSDWLTVVSEGVTIPKITGISTSVDDSGVITNGGLKFKVIEIGTWNMDSTTDVSIAHGLDYDDIISVTAFIKSDTDHFGNMLNGTNITGQDFGGIAPGETNIVLQRANSGAFDNTGFDGSQNRGYITIQYK